MRYVNAQDIRNHLGALLDDLEKTGEPIVVSKDRNPRAVLISIEDFHKRLVDPQTEERSKALLDRVRNTRAERVGDADSLSVLRSLRGDLG